MKYYGPLKKCHIKIGQSQGSVSDSPKKDRVTPRPNRMYRSGQSVINYQAVTCSSSINPIFIGIKIYLVYGSKLYGQRVQFEPDYNVQYRCRRVRWLSAFRTALSGHYFENGYLYVFDISPIINSSRCSDIRNNRMRHRHAPTTGKSLIGIVKTTFISTVLSIYRSNYNSRLKTQTNI